MSEYDKLNESIDHVLKIIYGTLYMEQQKESPNQEVVTKLVDSQKALSAMKVLYKEDENIEDLLAEIEMVGSFVKEKLKDEMSKWSSWTRNNN